MASKFATFLVFAFGLLLIGAVSLFVVQKHLFPAQVTGKDVFVAAWTRVDGGKQLQVGGWFLHATK